VVEPAHTIADVPEPPAWQAQPYVAAFLQQIREAFLNNCPAARELADKLLRQTGTRLADWVDHHALPAEARLEALLPGLGFALADDRGAQAVWEHPLALVPRIELTNDGVHRLAIKVESVDDFLAVHGLAGTVCAQGGLLSPLRKARVAQNGNVELWVVERHGYRGWEVPYATVHQFQVASWHGDRFRARKREWDRIDRGFDRAEDLIYSVVDDLGADWASDLFFLTEREYWTGRNRAGQTQRARQDALGLGWANHDCHTYRSSRRHFVRLIEVLEALGLECRERFYAGEEAGWGSQILEQRGSAVVVRIDVDAGPDEVAGDFARQPLAPAAKPGAIDRWCELHGEAFLQAGMYRLACRCDLQTACRQLRQAGIEVTKPVADVACLKRAFTQGELWPIRQPRLAAALGAGTISHQQAESLLQSGMVGSQLGLVQRDEAYKGFERTGIKSVPRESARLTP